MAPQEAVAPAPAPRQNGRWQRFFASSLTPVVVLAASLALTGWVWRLAVRSRDEVGRLNFQKQTGLIQHRLEERISDCEYLLLAGVGLFSSHGEVGRTTWHEYVEGFRLEEKLAGAHSLGFSLRLAAAELPAHVQRIRAEGFPEYSVHPDGPRPDYNAIIYIEPFQGRNLQAFGYDMGTDPICRQAMETARDEGRIAMSGRGTFAREAPGRLVRTGFMMCAPVYAANRPHGTVAERRAALAGFVYSSFQADHFLDPLLFLTPPTGVSLEIYGDPAVPLDSLLYDSRTSVRAENAPPGFQPRYTETIRVVLLERPWTLVFKSQPSFEAAQASSTAPLTLAFGIVCSLLASGLVFAQSSRNRGLSRLAQLSSNLQQAQAGLEQRVRERTAELARVNTELEQDNQARRQAEAGLSRLSAHFQVLLNVASDGIHVLDEQGNLCESSESFRRMLGYTADEAAGLNVRDWVALIPRDQLLERIQAVIRQSTVFEALHRRKDGTVFPVEINARGIELDGRKYIYASARDISERKQAEQELRLTATQLQEAQEIAHMGSFVHDLASNQVASTAQRDKILGLGPGSPKTFASWLEQLHPGDRATVEAAVTGCREQGVPFDLDYRIIRPSDGQVRWLRGIARPELGPGGRVARIIGVNIDITERRAAEQAVQESEKRFAAMADAAPVLIWTTGPDGLCTYVNKYWLDFTGRTLEQELGHGWTDGMHPEDFPRCQEAYQGSFNARRPYRLEYRFRRHDGQYRWLLDHGVPRYQAAGGFAGYIGSCIDITELREAQDRLHLQGVAMEAAASAIVITDVDGVIQWVNIAFTHATGYAAAEVIGRKPSLLKSGLQTQAFYQEMWDTILAGRVWRGQLRNKRKDGSLYDEELSITPLRDPQGAISHFIAIKTDITERRLAEDALRTASAYARSLIEASLDPLVTIDVNGRIMDVNEASIRATGVPRAELVGTDFSLYFTEPDRAREGYQRVFAEGSVYDYPLVLRHVSGRTRQVLYNASVYRDPHGNVLGVFAAARDVTERHQAEQALLERVRHTQSLLRLSRHLERAQTYAEALQAARDEIRTVIGYQSLWVYLLSEDKTCLKALVAGGPLEDAVMSEQGTATLPIKGDRMLEQIATARDIVVVEDARTDERTNKALVDQLALRTIVNVPILLFDRHLGTIGTGTIGEEGVRPPSESEQDYLIALSSHMAITLDRIHLLTERRQAEAEREQFFKFFNISTDLMVFADPNGCFKRVNPAGLRMLGYTEAELLGQPFINFVHPDDRQATLDEMARQIRIGSSINFANRYLCQDGSVRWLSWRANYVESEQTTYATARDFTEQKQAEAALRESEAYNRTIVESSLDAIITLDAAGVITSWSPQAGQMFGWGRDEVVGRLFRDTLIAPAWRGRLDEILERLRQGGAASDLNRRVEQSALHRDGREFPVEISIVPVDLGQTRQYSAFIRDITERRQLLDQTIQDAQAKSDLLREVNHRVTNNLSSILGLVVGEKVSLTTAIRPVVKPVLDRLAQRIRGLLNAQRILSDSQW
ncbi:MAG: PAS domain S-box protein, partial [Opitutales bacterium]